MRQLVPLVVLVVLTMSVNAQIQKSPNNRVNVDEDYQYTEAMRRSRTIDEQMRIGLASYKAGDYQAAASAFGIVVSLDPKMFVAQHDLGVSHIRLGQYEAGAKELRNALALEPQSALSWHFLGFAMNNLNQPVEAVKCYLRAVEIDKSSGVTWNNLGHAYLEMNKLDEAGDAFQKRWQSIRTKSSR